MPSPEPDAVRTRIDGTTAEASLYPGGDAGALLVHGLASQRLALEPLAGALAERGLTVLVPDLRGHGASEGPRGVLSRQRVMADLWAWTQLLEEEDARLGLLGGHSLGGLWSLMAAPALEPDAVAVIASPATVRGELNPLELAAYRVAGATDALVRRLGFDTRHVPYQVDLDEILEDPEAIRRAEETDLIQRTVPLVNVPELLAIDGPAWARRVPQPALVAVGERDRLVDHASTRRIHEALPGQKTWMTLPGPHSMFLDKDGDACAERVASWVHDRLA